MECVCVFCCSFGIYLNKEFNCLICLVLLDVFLKGFLFFVCIFKIGLFKYIVLFFNNFSSVFLSFDLLFLLLKFLMMFLNIFFFFVIFIYGVFFD